MTEWGRQPSWEPPEQGYDDVTAPRPVTSVPWVPGQPDPVPAPAPPPDRRGRRRWWVLVVVVVLVGAGVTIGLTRPWSGGSGPAAPGPSASAGTSTPPTPLDLFVKYAKPGDCVAMTDLLDGPAGADARVVECGDPATTFTVVKRYSKPKSTAPCSSDESVRSERVDAVVCLTRVLTSGQCVLGNGRSPFFVSAVPCDVTPVAPFTQVLRVQSVAAAGTPLNCAAGDTPLAVSGRSVCVRRVAG